MKNVSIFLMAVPLLLLPLTVSARVNGEQTNKDITVSSPTWTVLSTKTFNPSPDPQTCIASGSADVKNPSKANSQYRLTLTLDNANPLVDGECERLLEFGGNDESSKQISNTCTFRGVSASSHTVRLLVRKAKATTPKVVVTDNSMTISCTDNPL